MADSATTDDVTGPAGAGLPPVSRQIWDMKYRLKAPDGAPVDATVADTWTRVARALAAPERDPAAWEERFRSALEGFRFLPAGRILAGAGTRRTVTLFNCFVMGTVPDDMGGIFAHLREAALTLQQGGGIGYDFSTLRPKGAPVAGVGADASGPVSFMDVWDSMCRTIMSAGSRRGAMMATLRCDHPDIELFIDAKREPGRLRNFNLSVLATDDFMAAVREDRPWPLRFDGRVFRTVPARALWDRIMRATYDYAEPGVIFIDRINEQNNLSYCETISATNPCVTAETWVGTAEGPRQVRELVGRPFTALLHGRPWPSAPEGFFPTGVRPVLRLRTREGLELRATADHPVRRVVARADGGAAEEWTALGALKPGDRVRLGEAAVEPGWPPPPGSTAEGEVAGYLLSLLVGDAALKRDKAVLSVWLPAAEKDAPADMRGVMAAAEAAARFLPHRADFHGRAAVAGRREYRLATAALRNLAARFGLAPGAKAVTPEIERASSLFQAAFLRGLFDADGRVQGSQAKGVSIWLAQSDLERLRAVQRMLLRLGIVSTLAADRRARSLRLLPEGRGGRRPCAGAADHELIIARDNVGRFAARIGFADADKAGRLRAALSACRRRPDREDWTAEVAELVPDGEAEVFDVRIPGANAFEANGLVVHNCGEQPLPPYGACLLGSVNLAALVRDPFTPAARLDREELARVVPLAVRMMDNVVDVSRFPLEAQEAEAQAKRRIGLGVTGLADALILCGVRYGSEAGVRLTEEWLRAIQVAAYRTSAALAAEKGAFPLFDREAFLERPMVRALPPDVREAIAAQGVRNALVTSIAPTGTISLFAGNVSSGIEPVFAYEYQRAVLMPDGSRRTETVQDLAYRLYRERMGPDAPLTDAFVDAQSLEPAAHLVMQAAAQRHVDSAISKTINCPADLPFEAFKDVYRQAYELGCKGCTTYRPNAVTGSVLSVQATGGAPAAAPAQAPVQPPVQAPVQAPGPTSAPGRAEPARGEGAVVYMTRPLDRPEALPGHTYKVKWPDSDHALYITVNDIVQDGRRRPFEVFINSKNMEHYAWTVALTRMISAVFRRGGDVSFVVEELKAVFDPRGGQWVEGRYVPSLLAAIGQVIERHMLETGFLPRPGAAAGAPRLPAATGGPAAADPAPDPDPGPATDPSAARLGQCPRCAQATLLRQEGCDLCTNCGYSRCG
ncbi:LAGLIDADG family homing endonuclease [Rhodospirillum centenum]|uniref:Ribonucleoside-diphosphate reductase n=1 Tax=Rhodospirillum centenum (strain ATCC 51521 / SW) TaxID=414684 RepID=B6IYQ9_RHOCS|nr:LAGLIDADG family homing endonuclease [Rhodospirillum centenum]ACJ01433.1 ribonucleoside-diphosphate reductase, putative [Rhodospirillum centenum SW]